MMVSRGGARGVGVEVLQAVERPGVFADDALERALGRAGLDVRERALTWELVYGVLRRRGTLDWRLDQVGDRPMERLPLAVKTVLRLGAYQLLYLDRIPASAAVNESVALTKQMTSRLGRDWTGFVNAVLRNLIRRPAPPWPDAKDDPVAALAIRYACPAWLVTRWLDRLGPERAEAQCRATLEIPPLTIRVNRLKTTREALAADLTHAGRTVRKTAFSPVGLVIEGGGSPTELPAFHEGHFYIEDEAGQLVPPLLDPQPGERVLDACAAPGGKATHLSALMQDRGLVVAMDRSAARLRRVEENCRRLGVRTVVAVTGDAGQQAVDRPFDRILVDAPCSGLGVLRRHPEGKWQKRAERLPEHQSGQLAILERVAPLLRPGGILVYSTCSTEPEENEQVIERFCARRAEFRRETVAPWLPPSARTFLTAQGDFSTMTADFPQASRDQPWSPPPMDCFFAARLRKGARS
jgi:16S rRNA (cytosine967-C5)-methyltransferase